MKSIFLLAWSVFSIQIMFAQIQPQSVDSGMVLYINSGGKRIEVPVVSLKGIYDKTLLSDTCKLTIVWNDAKAGWGIKSFYENDSLPTAPKWSRIKEGGELPKKTEGQKGAYYINTVTNTLYGPKTELGWGVSDSLAEINEVISSENEVFEKGKTVVLDADGTVDTLQYNREYLITKWESYNATIYLPKAENHRGDWIIINMVTCNDFKIWIKSASVLMLHNTTINFGVQKEFAEFNLNVSGYAKIVSDGKKWIGFGIEGSDW